MIDETVDISVVEDVPVPAPAPPAPEPDATQAPAAVPQESETPSGDTAPIEDDAPVLDGLDGEEGGSVFGELVTEVPVPTPEPRPFLTTSFEDYTVVEGFMLVFLVCLFIAGLYQLVRRFI